MKSKQKYTKYMNLSSELFKDNNHFELSYDKDFDDFEFEIIYEYNESSLAFDYIDYGGKSATHDPGGSDIEVIILSVKIYLGNDKDFIELLNEKGLEYIESFIKEHHNN